MDEIFWYTLCSISTQMLFRGLLWHKDDILLKTYCVSGKCKMFQVCISASPDHCGEMKYKGGYVYQVRVPG